LATLSLPLFIFAFLSNIATKLNGQQIVNAVTFLALRIITSAQVDVENSQKERRSRNKNQTFQESQLKMHTNAVKWKIGCDCINFALKWKVKMHWERGKTKTKTKTETEALSINQD